MGADQASHRLTRYEIKGAAHDRLVRHEIGDGGSSESHINTSAPNVPTGE